MTFVPTDEQRRVLETKGNVVVIANPGSGKTSTLARLIQLTVCKLPTYRGVVAISYTNRASTELKSRALDGGIDPKGSFFGTIDKFFLAEILFPFGERVLGNPRQDLQVLDLTDAGLRHTVGWTEADLQVRNPTADVLPVLTEKFRDGVLILEAVGFLAVHVYRQSAACRRYLCARYAEILIDEYQDCGYWQHQLFLALCSDGLRGIAVGDLNQSIFAFAHKDPRYLSSLTEADEFTTLPLTFNHRSHPSIVAYSTRLIAPQVPITNRDEKRVYWKAVDGHEGQVGEWLTKAIPAAARKFSNGRLGATAVLTKLNRTAALVQAALDLPNKYFLTTPLDTDSSPSSHILRSVLLWLFDPKVTRTDLMEDLLVGRGSRSQRRRVVNYLVALEDMLSDDLDALRGAADLFAELGAEINGRPLSRRALEALRAVLGDETMLESYIPAQSNEVQILTIYKAKGQEYDQVFHLDMHAGVLPYSSRSEFEDRNLHYVGITRARHACVLVTSKSRHTGYGTMRATPSSFMTRPDLAELSVRLP